MFWQELLFIGAGFLLGNILFSYHLPKLLKGVDTVAVSKDANPGTANAMKYAGVPIGLMCLFMDMFKGFLPVYLSIRAMGVRFPALPLVMLAPVLGHAMALWYPFRGGKCIATVFGVLIGLMPFSNAAWMLVFWYLFFSLIIVIHPNEKRSVYTFFFFAACCALGAALWTHHYLMALGCVIVASVAGERNLSSYRRMEKERQLYQSDLTAKEPIADRKPQPQP